MTELTLGQLWRFATLVDGISLGEDGVWYKLDRHAEQIDSNEAHDVAFGLRLIREKHGDHARITEIEQFWIYYTVNKPLTQGEVDDLKAWAEQLSAEE